MGLDTIVLHILLGNYGLNLSAMFSLMFQEIKPLMMCGVWNNSVSGFLIINTSQRYFKPYKLKTLNFSQSERLTIEGYWCYAKFHLHLIWFEFDRD